MLALKPRVHPLFALVLVPALFDPPSLAQDSVESLLNRIPAYDAADGNPYLLTDVQSVLDADLFWNSLLQRAILENRESGLSITLVVDSRMGRCQGKNVEWPIPPTLRAGQLFVSRGLLETALESHTGFSYPQPEEEGGELPPIPEEEGPGSDEPPTANASTESAPIRSVLAILMPSDVRIWDSTNSVRGATDVFSIEFLKSLEDLGIEGETAVWSANAAERTYGDTDAIVAVRIAAGVPPPPTSFFYYDNPSPPNAEGRSQLMEWNRVSGGHRERSEEIAQHLHRRFVQEFGENRSIGTRTGPIDLLEGRQSPSVLVNLGVLSSSAEAEIAKAAHVLGEALKGLRAR